MKWPTLLTLLFLFTVQSIIAQCYCEDCPEPIIFGSPSTVTLNVSGITNNILGQNGQSLINTGVHFTHDAAEALSLRLVAPNGSFVDLTIGDFTAFGELNFFDINFVQCSGSASPDCTNNATWTSTDSWDGGPYTGSYFPESGCLEDLTGDVNGTWTIEIEDVFIFDFGELYCFELTFEDDTGAICNSSGCSTPLCLAQGGLELSPFIVTAPEGDPSLLIDYTVIYDECEFEVTDPDYIFIYVIFNPSGGAIIEIQQGTVDLTTYEEGTYSVQGYSILATDLPVLESLDFASSTLSDIYNLITAGTICADFTYFISSVFIENCAIDFTGNLEFDVIVADAGDPDLDPVWDITWSPSDPDFNVYGLYYVVYEVPTGTLIGYFTEDDFTNLPAGEYIVTILVYLLTEEPLLPAIDGNSVWSDIVTPILNDELCAIFFGSNQLVISEPCTINVNAILEQEDITAPQNDPALDPDWDITFTDTPPDPTIYGFYYVVVNADTDLLVAYYTTDDFTLLLEGNYYVTVVYYLLDDQQVLPPPNGMNTFLDLVNLINNDELCAQYFGYNLLNIIPQCEADAGSFSSASFSECEGVPELVLDLTPQYSGAAPDSDYGYTYVVSQNGVVIAIDPSTDFTSYAIGDYEICGLSYLLDNEPLLPSPNGSLTTADIIDDINNDEYCADLMTDCADLTIVEAPMPIFTGPTEVCAGEEVNYVVENFSGNNGDYLYNINQGSFFQFINNDDGTLSVIWSGGPGNICVTQFEDGCEAQTCLTVEVTPLIEITITGPDEVCPGEEVEYTFSPTPEAGEFYDITLSNGTIVDANGANATILWGSGTIGSISVTLEGSECGSEQEALNVSILEDADFPMVDIPATSCVNTGLTIPDIDDPDIIDWEWSATNADFIIQSGFVNFTWQSIGFAEICLEITTACGMEQMCFDVDVLEAPEPLIQPESEFCSFMFTLDATPSIGNSWFWSSPGSGGSVSYTDQTNFTTEVTVTGPGTYTFILQEFSSDCIGLVETTVTISDGLSTSMETYFCDDDGFYTVSFDILSGTGPYTVDGIGISGNSFTSQNIASGDAYIFEVEDSEGCTATVAGLFTCPCITDAGTMSGDPIILCISEGTSGQATHNNDGTFDFDDIGMYVLHTGDGTSLGVVISNNASGEFFFDPMNMVAGQVYYISYVVGNEDSGIVDLLDPCLSIAAGQPIVFYDDPDVNAGADAETCQFIFDLSANSISTGGSWTIIAQPQGSMAEIQIVSQSSFLEVDLAGTYTVSLGLSENGCFGSDEVEITFLDSPVASNISTACDGESYTVTFDIEGGTAPYLVNGDLVSGSTFTSMPISSGDVYGFTIVDTEGCSSDLIQGTEVCNCITDAGTMSQEEISICAIEGELISATFNNDATLEENDGGVFVLHTSSSNILGTIVASNSGPNFTYLDGFGSDVTLYVSYLASDTLPSGTFDLNDECLSVAIGQPVYIAPLSKVDAGEYSNLCEWSFDLNAEDQGEAGSWSVIESPADANITFGNTSDAQSTFEADQPGTYRIAWSASDAPCMEADTAAFVLSSFLTIENSNVNCSDDLETYIISIEVSGGVAPYFLDAIEVGTSFDLDPIVSGDSYSYTLTDSRGCELTIEGAANCDCMNVAGSMALDTLKGCVTDTLVGTYNNDAIPDMNDRELFVLHTSSSDTLGAVFFISDSPIAVFRPGMIVDQVYYLSHVMGDEDGPGIDFSDPCLRVAIGQPVIFSDFPAVDAGADQVICGLSTILEGIPNTAGNTWSVIETPFGAIETLDPDDPMSELTVSLPGDYLFELAGSNGFCTSTDTVLISFIPGIEFNDLIIDCQAGGYTVLFSVSGGVAPYFVDGVEITGNVFLSSLVNEGESYSFIIEDSGSCEAVVVSGEDVCACENDAGTMSPDLVELCMDEIIDLNTLNNNDAILDDDDVRYHVIHTSPNNELGDVLGYQLYVAGVQELTFQDYAFEVGVTYYVSTVLANMGVLENGDEDLCLKVAEGTPLVWRDFSQVSFGEDVVACQGETIMIEITAQGTLPFEIVITDDLGFGESVLIDEEDYLLEYVVTGNATLSLEIPVNAKCLNIGDGTMDITIEELPEAEVREAVTICNNANFGSEIELAQLIDSGYEDGRWIFYGNEIQGSIDFDGFEAGEYVLEYEITSLLCAASNSYSVAVTVEDCDCPMFDYTFQNITCFGASDGAISIIVSDEVELSEYSIFLNNEELPNETEIENLDAGNYTLDITNGNNCVASFDIEILDPEAVQISLGEDMEVEINDPIVIEAITNLLEQEIEEITWTSLSGILDDNDLLLNTSFQANDMISISILDENDCEGYDDIMVRVTMEDYTLPNVINTNSTSGNDVFRIYNSETIEEVVNFSIYDRWGNEMYGVKNVLPDSEAAQWDGTFSGSTVTSGVYVYRIVLSVGGKEVVVVGDLTVM